MERLFQLGPSGDEGQFRVVAYYFRQWDGFNMALHSTNATEIMYAISGTCRIEIVREQGTTDSITLRKGEFIILDANVPHRLIVEKGRPCRMLNVEFVSSPKRDGLPSIGAWAAEDARLSALLAAPLPYIVLRDPDDIYHNLKRLVLELDALAGKQDVMVQLLLWQLLVRIAQLWHDDLRSGEAGADANAYVKRCMEFLQQHYDQDIAVKDIASAVNLHPGYLHRIFKAHTGRTILEVLNAHRMEKAKMLLAQTQIPIRDISEYVGINSRQYFQALFKQHAHQTPSEYRRAYAASSWDRKKSEDF